MISLGKAIYTLLAASEELKSYVGKNIFPLITPERVNLPCVIYERQSTANYSKDGVTSYESQVYITCISQDYANSVAIAEECYNALEGFRGSAADIPIVKLRINNAQETYQEDVFIQRLSFDVTSR